MFGRLCLICSLFVGYVWSFNTKPYSYSSNRIPTINIPSKQLYLKPTKLKQGTGIHQSLFMSSNNNPPKKYYEVVLDTSKDNGQVSSSSNTEVVLESKSFDSSKSKQKPPSKNILQKIKLLLASTSSLIKRILSSKILKFRKLNSTPTNNNSGSSRFRKGGIVDVLNKLLFSRMKSPRFWYVHNTFNCINICFIYLIISIFMLLGHK